jgi:serine/threonine-protein kinase RsbT
MMKPETGTMTSLLLWQPTTTTLGMARLRAFQLTAGAEQCPEQHPERFAAAADRTSGPLSHMHPDITGSRTPKNLFAAPLSSRVTSLRAEQNSGTYDAVFKYLERKTDTVAARTIIRGVFFIDTGITPQTLAWVDVRTSSSKMLRKLRIYMHNASDAETALQEILDLQTVQSNIEIETIEINTERDIKTARGIARRMAIAIGFARLQETQLVTAASELARNIFKYAGSGTIKLSPLKDQKGIEIVAQDRGPGIPNLDEILSGGYTSKTGMGRGILGTRDMMTMFDIKTTRGIGTTITATMIKK